jgi:hypothetical protein
MTKAHGELGPIQESPSLKQNGCQSRCASCGDVELDWTTCKWRSHCQNRQPWSSASEDSCPEGAGGASSTRQQHVPPLDIQPQHWIETRWFVAWKTKI